ncbi:Vps45p [Maudiozyma barnettii]|mgnify:CR=1 FL=1|uniref:Similar to Saccharomyces cerevisiae YGL095C VPS45 Protein of the Sec1p/Munc-18 family, essential for vacuolar protein sorting n=1 Tax=Maudiozyma barnettii TaxID=61262 RepID=A0A8H2VJU6_9SACH|nr:Vps45p [Kazachstania barnettii]CAB4256708.1 similar to Saccharomyces cerevisiae YGL095C VPS45 Protein of the Sec1p/Munc-18 family, essential for vacuolar protein sorting [Kazachstania barnettii]
MDLFKVGDFYTQRIFNSQGRANGGFGEISGSKKGTTVLNESRIKVLLLDKDTTPVISMCATQSDLLKHEIYLVETVENNKRDIMRHLKCLVYVKPTDKTIDCLVKELENPRYGEYHIFFNNMVSKSQLERLAEADSLSAVVKVEEIFQDYQVLNEYLFSFDMDNRSLLTQQGIWSEGNLESTTSCLTSLLLSLKIKPEIRYDSGSKVCRRLAQNVDKTISTNEKVLFDFPKMDSSPCLIILDRNADPYTPLLQPWTYQSMINEYIGIKRNIVDLKDIPHVDKLLAKVTLSSKEDQFFKETRYLNFGELGDKVSSYVNKYKDSSQINSQLDSIADIKKFIEKYPEFKKLSGNVSKHMAIVGELDRQLADQNIWEVSEVEQNLVVHKEYQGDYEALLKLLKDPKIDKDYKLKLGCIYFLRHDELDSDGKIERINEILEVLKQYLPAEDINYIHKFRKQFQDYNKKGASNSNTDASSGGSGTKDDLLSELTKRFNSKMDLHRRIHDNSTDNVYMQYVPSVSRILSELSSNKLSESVYKTLGGDSGVNDNSARTSPPPQDVVLFIVGGVTFEESRLVYEFNETMKDKQAGRMRVVLGGTSVVNTTQYINFLR